MEYIKCRHYDEKLVREKIMGPNPIKLEEELLLDHRIPPKSLVLDLGCGQGLTSVFLVREYGFRVYAADLWSKPDDNQRFFESMNLSPEQIIAVSANAENLPFEKNYFDAVISTDSYNYFGRNGDYLDAKLLPFVKSGGYLYIAIPGMKKDCHNHLPSELLLSWTPEQLEYMHDIVYWRSIIEKSQGAEIISIHEMISHEEVWNDWLACDNEYAHGDRKAMEAGGGQYLNFIAIILRKK